MGVWRCASRADIRICSESATFGNAAILLGLSGAEMGMSYFLPRVVGLSVAADWMLTGRTVSADEADRRGLVSELVDGEHLVGRAVELASQIAGHSALGCPDDEAGDPSQHGRGKPPRRDRAREPEPSDHPCNGGGCGSPAPLDRGALTARSGPDYSAAGNIDRSGMARWSRQRFWDDRDRDGLHSETVFGHPRLSVNSVSSVRQSLADDIEMWGEIGIDHVALILPKIDQAGWDEARTMVTGAGLRVSDDLRSDLSPARCRPRFGDL